MFNVRHVRPKHCCKREFPLRGFKFKFMSVVII